MYSCVYTVGATDSGLFKAKVSALADTAGNSGSAQAFNTDGVIIDTAAPTNSAGAAVTGPSSVKTKETITLTGITDAVPVLAGDYIAVYSGTGSDEKKLGSSDAFAADGDGATPWTVSGSARDIGKGTHTLTAYYYDAAGNRTSDASPPTHSLIVRSSAAEVARVVQQWKNDKTSSPC